jgi:superfamily II DNA helicase RecQ
VVFNDRTLAALAERRPRSRAELLAVDGIGPAKLDRYGDELLGLLATDG